MGEVECPQITMPSEARKAVMPPAGEPTIIVEPACAAANPSSASSGCTVSYLLAASHGSCRKGFPQRLRVGGTGLRLQIRFAFGPVPIHAIEIPQAPPLGHQLASPGPPAELWLLQVFFAVPRSWLVGNDASALDLR